MKTIFDLYDAYIPLLKGKSTVSRANLVREELGDIALDNLLETIKAKYGEEGILSIARSYTYTAFLIKVGDHQLMIDFADKKGVKEIYYEKKDWLSFLCSMIWKVTNVTGDEILLATGREILSYANDVVKRKNEESSKRFHEELARLEKETREIYGDDIDAKVHHQEILNEMQRRKYTFDKNIDNSIELIKDVLNEVYREVGYVLAHRSLCREWGKDDKKMVSWCNFLRKQTWAIAKLASSAQEKAKQDIELGISDLVLSDNYHENEKSVGITIDKDEEPSFEEDIL